VVVVVVVVVVAAGTWRHQQGFQLEWMTEKLSGQGWGWPGREAGSHRLSHQVPPPHFFTAMAIPPTRTPYSLCLFLQLESQSLQKHLSTWTCVCHLVLDVWG
jgi:hypothetical protein